MPPLAMIVGISGVGKTTFVHSLRTKLDFQHLTAGSLIAASKESMDAERDGLRFADLNDNQDHLIKGLDLVCDRAVSLVLLDGHVVIHTNNGLEELNSDVFYRLGVQAFLHLVAAPEQIDANRRNDVSRQRPVLTLKELSAHQEASLKATERVARSLAIPWKPVTYEEAEVAERFLSKLTGRTH